MKTPALPTVPTVEQIAAHVRTALDRTNATLLAEREGTSRGKRYTQSDVQNMRGILVGELHSVGVFPEDAYELLYRYSVENNDETTYMEELLFLEHCIR